MLTQVTAAKEPVATLMSIFAVSQRVIKKLVPNGKIEQSTIDTIVTNKILKKCEESMPNKENK